MGLGSLIGGAIGSVVPGVGTAIGSAIGGATSNLFNSGGAESSVPTLPQYQSGVTPEQLAAALAAQGRFTGQLENIYGTPTTVGGVGATQTSQIAPQQIKKQEFVRYRMSQGDSYEQATKKANKIISDPNKTFKGNKGFMGAVQQGFSPDVSIGKDGRLIAADKYQGGGIQTPGSSQALRGAIDALNMQSVLSANGLPQMFGSDIASALSLRDPLRNQLLSQVIGSTEDGLTQRDLADIDAILAARTQQLDSLNKTNTAGTVADLLDRGFMSSNLAGEALQKSVFKPQNDFLTQLGGELADRELNMRNATAARRSQALSNTLNVFNAAASPYQLSSVLSGIQNPSSAGLFTDQSAGQLAAQIQQQNIGNRLNNQQMTNALAVTPQLITPQMGVGGGAPGGSILSQLGPAIGGVASQAISGLGNKFGNMAGNAITSVAGKIKK